MKELTLLIITIFAISTLIFGIMETVNSSQDDLPLTPYTSVNKLEKVCD